jgi:hypothetical protein
MLKPKIRRTNQLLGISWYPSVDRILEEGKLQPHQPTIMGGGLRGVADGLEKLKKAKLTTRI